LVKAYRKSDLSNNPKGKNEFNRGKTDEHSDNENEREISGSTISVDRQPVFSSA
jgi:hypothetical protein